MKLYFLMLYRHRKIAFISLESTFDTFTAASDSQSSTSDIPNTSKIKFQHVKFLLQRVCKVSIMSRPRPLFIFYKYKSFRPYLYDHRRWISFKNRGLSGKGEGCGSKILSTNPYQVVPHFQGINSFTLNPALLK